MWSRTLVWGAAVAFLFGCGLATTGTVAPGGGDDPVDLGDRPDDPGGDEGAWPDEGDAGPARDPDPGT